ncbi:uncharacterized protein LOC120349489 isoform X1 [Nilaparvata lugens]|uniref:uncharacterized protein LOC120349489 isoform X1 n=1 Tax=Nilaparvata lugens TaxID=108931 RepID=UPI00193E7F58|nr:uncharacterized protein LOC120349489 isoform X1 [Nilaparvata lugens]
MSRGAKDIEAVALVIDCGLKSSKDSQFLEKCKECATNIILKKIFSESKDVLSVIVLGSEATSHPLDSDGGYRHIEVVLPFMVASWDLVTAVSGLSINHRVTNSDWCDALVVAMQCLKEKMDDTKNMKKVNHITTAKLVMLSSFSQDVDDSCMDSVVSAIINTDMEVIFIAPDEVAERIEEDSTGKTLSHGENALRKVIEKVSLLKP